MGAFPSFALVYPVIKREIATITTVAGIRAGVSGDSLEKRFAHYHKILEHAAGKIEILPGGGIDMDNRQTFIDQLGVTQLHGTKVVF